MIPFVDPFKHLARVDQVVLVLMLLGLAGFLVGLALVPFTFPVFISLQVAFPGLGLALLVVLFLAGRAMYVSSSHRSY